MVVRGAASLAGFVGGALLLLSGVVAFLLGLGPRGEGLLSAVAAGLVPVVVGLLVILISRPGFWWWRSRVAVNALLLLVLGVVAWVLGAEALLTEVGALLTVIAGALLLVSVVFASPSAWRRRSARRYF